MSAAGVGKEFYKFTSQKPRQTSVSEVLLFMGSFLILLNEFSDQVLVFDQGSSEADWFAEQADRARAYDKRPSRGHPRLYLYSVALCMVTHAWGEPSLKQTKGAVGHEKRHMARAQQPASSLNQVVRTSMEIAGGMPG